MFGKNKTITCLVCSQAVPIGESFSHEKAHMIAVTDNNDQRAYTFKCPRCGPMDRAWGGGREEEAAREDAVQALRIHFMAEHGISR